MTNRSVGLIGLGAISQFYLAAFKRIPVFSLKAVCDIDETRWRQSHERSLSYYMHYQDLLNQDDISAVIVNVPNDLHFQICRDALLTGKHVCCEKPLTVTVEEAQELVAISQQQERTLFTAFHRRYNRNFRQVLQQLPQRGPIKKVQANYWEKIEDHMSGDHWYLQPERCGGGCIADNGPNIYDTLSFFLGDLRVTSVTALRNTQNVDFFADIYLNTTDNIPVHVQLDWAYSAGEKKDLTISFQGGNEVYIDMLQGFPAFKSSLFHEYEEILLDFDYSIQKGQDHGEDGLKAVQLVEETYRLATRP